MAKPRKRRGGVEWIGGLGTMPAYVTEGPEPYRPEVLLWMRDGGGLLGAETTRPGEAIAAAAQSLQATIERPMIGRPHMPTRIRVASSELADVLRTAHPDIEIVHAPTPEIDAVLEVMGERFADSGDDPSYLVAGVDAAAIGSFFAAAAELFRVAPWTVIPNDYDVLRVDIDALDVHGVALSVIGQMGESLGLAFFADYDEFETFAMAAEMIERGGTPRLPPHLALNFERGADLPEELRKEIAENGWPLAGALAYPWLMAVDEEIIARPPSAKEIRMVESVALALPEVLGDAALVAAFEGGEPWSATLSVSGHEGEVQVTLRAPYEDDDEWSSPFDVLADLHTLVGTGEEIESEHRKQLEDQLFDEFKASPEAEALTEFGSCRLLMDLAADYLGATIATLDAADLREVLFELVPRSASVEPEEAQWIIDEHRAFYAFLKREYGLPQADRCLDVLNGDAVAQLERALSDPRKFGMAKTMFMEMRASKSSKAKATKNNRRKQARKSRKKNR